MPEKGNRPSSRSHRAADLNRIEQEKNVFRWDKSNQSGTGSPSVRKDDMELVQEEARRKQLEERQDPTDKDDLDPEGSPMRDLLTDD